MLRSGHDLLSAFALGDYAVDFVESAVGARCSILHDIAANFACSTALTRL
jgi:hypothetical protein